MRYYIYGKGGNGKVIAWVIDLLNKETGLKHDYCFIDDSSSSLSLLALRERIVQDKESLIVISSVVYKEEMINKCLKNGLMNYCDGVRYFGKRLNAYYKGKFTKSKNIAFLLDDLGFKHFGNIQRMLLEKGYEVFYFCFEHKDEFHKGSLESLHALLLTVDFLPYLNFCYFIIGTSMQYRFDISVKYLRLMPSYDIPFDHSYFHTPSSLIYRLLCYDVLAKMGSYFVAHNKKAYIKIYQNLDGNHTHLLPLGYPSLDRVVKTYKEHSSSFAGKRDTIICNSRWRNAVNGIAMKERMIEVVDLLLKNGYRVCYKINPNYDFSLQAQVAKRWENRTNFCFFTEQDLSMEELNRSITLVDFGSSLLYTYPLITHKPSIMLQPSIEWFRLNCHIVDHFYEERLQLKVYSNTDLLEYIERLKNDLEFKEERAKMVDYYIKNETYHFGCASEAVVNFIDNYYNKWIADGNFKYQDHL